MVVQPPNPNIPRLTTQQEIIQGFTLQFLTKWDQLIVNRYAGPIINFENNLQAIQATTLSDFVRQLNGNILDNCYTAIGASDKAKQHLPTSANTIRGYITNALTIAQVTTISSAINMLTIGFSLISGDSLGGSSRNLVGNRGEDIIQVILINNFAGVTIASNSAGRPKITQFTNNNSNYFVHWNKRIPIAGKNYDFIITNNQNFSENDIIGVLEIKSGCDPAGADEHWNTAKGKLSTLNTANPAINCGFASIIIDQTVRNHIAQEIGNRLLTCGINLNDNNEIIRGIVSLL